MKKKYQKCKKSSKICQKSSKIFEKFENKAKCIKYQKKTWNLSKNGKIKQYMHQNLG